MSQSAAQKPSQADLDRLNDMFGYEPLHDDLAAYMTNNFNLGRCLKHPLVFCIFYNEALNKTLNRQYEQKKIALEEAWAEEDWHRYIFLHERPYRINALQEILRDHAVHEQSFWQLVRQVWTDSENIYQCREEWADIWGSEVDRSSLMLPDEIKALDAMGEVIQVWRGAATEKHCYEGMSWTTDRKKAEWFARRYVTDARPIIAQGVVHRSHVLAYFTNRGENEIIATPETVTIVETKRLPRRRTG